jgi:hypothetical protein
MSLKMKSKTKYKIIHEKSRNKTKHKLKENGRTTQE